MDLELERSYPTPVSNSTLLPLLLLSLATEKHTPNTVTSIKDEYDYIVVGGGAAGSVVASRLSEDSDVSVLVLEAGPKPPRLTEVPALSTYFQGADTDWKFKIVPQKHGLTGLINRQTTWSLGKMLGGSSSHNDMAYFRGNRKNYDDWEAEGCKGWSYKDVFPYFLKLEDNKDSAFLANGYHATGGPITVQKPPYQSNLKKILNQAAKSLGYKFVDTNAARQTGFSCLQHNWKNGQRCSTVKGYLVPAENRTNLDIMVNALVTKVRIDGGRATGVEFYYDNQFKTVRDRREVVVSAGAVNTPKLLLLSGIGPRKDLERLNIPVIADLPVGKNLQVHIGSKYFIALGPGFEFLDEKLSKDEHILDYIYNRTGPLTEPFLMGALLNGRNVTKGVDFPTYSILFEEVPKKAIETYNVKPEIRERLFTPYENTPLVMCLVEVLQPKSRGTVSLFSTNPFVPPLIDPNFSPSDLEPTADGLKMCRKIASTAIARKFGMRPIDTLLPGCEMYEGSEDEYFQCYANTLTEPSAHECGTCKMGDPEDPTTVVDPKLRVKNVKRLRVVDASVMPRITSGNTHSPVIMIGEKASDIIKQSMKRQCH